ncbi:MAG: dihydropteroate synthase, partial [Peptococcaceae bacterium]|nr:dihydropteroate synthase [Peptococcaceae bacterium]
ELTKANCSCGIVLDSPNPQVIMECLPLCNGRKVIVNSITLSDKYDRLISAVKECGAGVICLPISDGRIPADAESRFENAAKMIEKLQSVGIAPENIYIDVLIEAVATNQDAAATTLKTVAMLTKEYKDVNTVCGLSNVSFGLPCRAKLNSAFLSMLMSAGLKAAILDAASASIADTVCIANALLGEDEYCMDYITRFRS